MHPNLESEIQIDYACHTGCPSLCVEDIANLGDYSSTKSYIVLFGNVLGVIKTPAVDFDVPCGNKGNTSIKVLRGMMRTINGSCDDSAKTY
jgi:hypothetical protein